MGSLAATRAIFVIPTTIHGCYNTGGVGGGVCYKRDLAKRDGYIAGNGYLATMVVAAILAAVQLYVPPTFPYFVPFVLTIMAVFSSLYAVWFTSCTGTVNVLLLSTPTQTQTTRSKLIKWPLSNIIRSLNNSNLFQLQLNLMCNNNNNNINLMFNNRSMITSKKIEDKGIAMGVRNLLWWGYTRWAHMSDDLCIFGSVLYFCVAS
jgi:hypothetical protein